MSADWAEVLVCRRDAEALRRAAEIMSDNADHATQAAMAAAVGLSLSGQGDEYDRARRLNDRANLARLDALALRAIATRYDTVAAVATAIEPKPFSEGGPATIGLVKP